MADDLEIFWASILSEKPDKIRVAWESLDAEEQTAVYAHLYQMATEEGWSELQKAAAQTALSLIKTLWPDHPG